MCPSNPSSETKTSAPPSLVERAAALFVALEDEYRGLKSAVLAMEARQAAAAMFPSVWAEVSKPAMFVEYPGPAPKIGKEYKPS